MQDCKRKMKSNLETQLRKLATGQLSHLETIEEVVLVEVVDGEVVEVTLLLGHVLHRRLAGENTQDEEEWKRCEAKYEIEIQVPLCHHFIQLQQKDN